MKDEIEGSSSDGQAFVFCPGCGRMHYSKMPIMDEYVDCRCGLSFYAFSCSGLRIIMPAGEAGCEYIARAMRRFVVTTGRCTEIPSELYQDENGQLCFGFLKHSSDIGEQLDIALEEFQNEHFGECYLTKEMVLSIGESFKGGDDVELRKKKKGVDVIRLIKKRLDSPERKCRPNREIEKKGQAQLMIPGNGIMMHFQALGDVQQRMPARRN